MTWKGCLSIQQAQGSLSLKDSPLKMKKGYLAWWIMPVILGRRIAESFGPVWSIV